MAWYDMGIPGPGGAADADFIINMLRQATQGPQFKYQNPNLPTMTPAEFAPRGLPPNIEARGPGYEIQKPPVPPVPPMPRNPSPAAAPMLPDINTLPAINSVPYGAPPAPPTPAPKSFDWGPENSLWGALGAIGQGISKPSLYGFGGQLSQGISSGAEFAQSAPLRQLQMRKLKAEVGTIEQKGETLKAAKELAAMLPANHPARAHLMFGNLEKAGEHLGMDPNKLGWMNERGEFQPNIALAQMKLAINAAQGALKYGVIGKDPSGHEKYGYPPLPPFPGVTSPLVPTQTAQAAPPTAAPAAAPPSTPGAPLAPGATGYTKGQEKQDQVFAEDVVKWKQEGRAETAKSLDSLRTVIDRFKKGERLTGPEFGLFPEGKIRASLFQSQTDALNLVQSVVQQSLRATLGGQFAEREGRQLVERTYNPSLPPEKNAARVARLITAIEQAAQAKEAMAEHFDKYGTLSGYKGPTIGELQSSVRSAVQDVAPAEKKADAPTQRVPTGKMLNNKPVYWNPAKRTYETD